MNNEDAGFMSGLLLKLTGVSDEDIARAEAIIERCNEHYYYDLDEMNY